MKGTRWHRFQEVEIKSVASLAEMCLRLRGEESPAMKEVEMALQTMRAKRFKSYQAAHENDKAMRGLIRLRAEDSTDHSFSQVGYSVDQPSKRWYSFEQEFISSAEVPR